MRAHGQLKGAAFLSTLQFIDARFGGDARARVLRRLADEDRAIVSGLLLPISWYPLPMFPRLLHALEAELGRGDLQVVADRGEWAAVNDLKTTHRIFMKLVSPGWVIEKATGLWKNFHDTGRWEVTRQGDRGADARLLELGVVDEAMCATLGGWIRGLLGVAGCKHIEIPHAECRVRGDASCLWRCTWG